ncbi:TMV resistance protein N-like protein [Corchorus olitorius]|uniref:TMV resistance protein N-like protein n=1 Tax=Corchorus olitorius TaxID=93759 RepID=A0A1R3H0C6_9ROSI|nr:TMV resistance protein N-like protein [Corchorus olitorius]
MADIEIPESVDIMCDVESDENQTETTVAGHDGNTNEVNNMDMVEPAVRKRATPSDKGSEPQQTSQNVAAEIDDDAMDHEVDDSEGDAMAQFYKHQMESGTVQQKTELEIYLQEDREKGSSEFDPMADTDEQAELDQLAQELKNVFLEPIIDN